LIPGGAPVKLDRLVRFHKPNGEIMTTTWILVSNASTARLYAKESGKRGLTMVKTFEHPESREKASELVSDQPGHYMGQGKGRGAFVEANPKEVEMERFALELAKELEAGRTHQAYGRLILVASPHFMGLLKARLSSHVLDLVSDTVEKDYSHDTEKELIKHLEPVILI
jgi:protein required for attachment to host cells